MNGMWADTLLALERGHLLRLLLWGASSVVAGSALLAWLTMKRNDAPLLRHFALQTATWGLIELAICGWGWRGLALRDYAGAQRLLNFLWLNIGLDAGYIAVGVTLAIAAWTLGKRAGAVGAGIGIIVQGMALALLDLRLATMIGPIS